MRVRTLLSIFVLGSAATCAFACNFVIAGEFSDFDGVTAQAQACGGAFPGTCGACINNNCKQYVSGLCAADAGALTIQNALDCAKDPVIRPSSDSCRDFFNDAAIVPANDPAALEHNVGACIGNSCWSDCRVCQTSYNRLGTTVPFEDASTCAECMITSCKDEYKRCCGYVVENLLVPCGQDPAVGQDCTNIKQVDLDSGSPNDCYVLLAKCVKNGCAGKCPL